MNQRIEEIKKILLAEKKADVVDLSERLSVSEVTIRKDLTMLEQHGFLLRRYGGAVLAEYPHLVVSALQKEKVLPTEKEAIATLAAELIGDGENLFLDAGSTNLALARKLRKRNLQVVTNSLSIASELLDDPEVVVEMIGGSLRKTSCALVGPRSCRALDDIRVDKVFLGCSGFDPKRGFSSENAVEAETKRRVLECGGLRIILADHSKFTRAAFANFARFDDIDMVVTDRKLAADSASVLRNHQIKIKFGKL